MTLPHSIVNATKQSSIKCLALAGALAVAAPGTAQGAITYVDPADIVIPFSYGGVYIDIVTAAESSSSQSGTAGVNSYTISHSEPTSWDINFFFGGAGIAHSDTFNPYRGDSSDYLSAISNLGINTTIDGSPVGGSAPLTTPHFGGSGTGIGGGLDGSASATHMGTGTSEFENGSEGYIGFILDPGASQKYGWMRVTLNDDGSTGLIHDWAYSDDPIDVGMIPEPKAALMLLLGALALMHRSRQQSA